MSKQQQQQQPQNNIYQFLDDKIMNIVGLWQQNTILGSTHVLYNKAIIDSILQDLKNIHTTLNAMAKPPPAPATPQKSPPKESKIAPPPTTTKK